jgi:hypothetical protein
MCGNKSLFFAVMLVDITMTTVFNNIQREQ